MVLFHANTTSSAVLRITLLVAYSNACVVYIAIWLSFLHLFVTLVELTTIACVSIVRIATITAQADLIALICVQTVTANAIIQAIV